MSGGIIWVNSPYFLKTREVNLFLVQKRLFIPSGYMLCLVYDYEHSRHSKHVIYMLIYIWFLVKFVLTPFTLRLYYLNLKEMVCL